MLEKYAEAIGSADPVTRVQLRSCFHLNRRMPLLELLEKVGLSQADVVLCLLRLNTVDSLRVAVAMVGRPITICPSSLSRYRPRPPLVRPRRGDDRLLVRVSQERSASCVLAADLHRRLAIARVGMSVQQLLARGVRRRDVLIATRRGYFELEETR